MNFQLALKVMMVDAIPVPEIMKELKSRIETWEKNPIDANVCKVATWSTVLDIKHAIGHAGGPEKLLKEMEHSMTPQFPGIHEN